MFFKPLTKTLQKQKRYEWDTGLVLLENSIARYPRRLYLRASTLFKFNVVLCPRCITIRTIRDWKPRTFHLDFHRAPERWEEKLSVALRSQRPWRLSGTGSPGRSPRPSRSSSTLLLPQSYSELKPFSNFVRAQELCESRGGRPGLSCWDDVEDRCAEITQ